MAHQLAVLLLAALPAFVLAADPPRSPPRRSMSAPPAPAFKIKDANGKEIDLAELTAKGPVLVRLTCGCSGCDKELAYFQAIHEAYKDAGLTSAGRLPGARRQGRRLRQGEEAQHALRRRHQGRELEASSRPRRCRRTS